MANISVRGLDDATLSALKRRAAREKVSANALAVRLIERGLGREGGAHALVRHDDLDTLVGCWSADEASAFAQAAAAFEEIDPQLWK